MLNHPSHLSLLQQAGTSLIEVLVTVVILAFGLLGLAAFQMRVQTAELESYQRAQALALLNDMAARIKANRTNAAGYATANTLGTGAANCTGANGTAAFDLCEWSSLLRGNSEQQGGTGVGAMIGARGCITQVQAPNPASGICAPGIYRVDVVWQGINATSAPAITCGSGSYGNDALRRAISTQVIIGLWGCN
jgi:type IV pilus assembly protein PilV